MNEAPLSVSMAFSPSTINPGGVSRLTYGLDNGTSVEARLVSLSDTLPAGVVLADPPNARRTCVTSSLGVSAPAEATLTVDASEAPGFAKAFSPPTVDPGGVSTLSFTIDNAANTIAVGSLAFDDDFPDGMAVAATPNGSTTCGGTFAPAASATSLAFSGGSVAAGGTCTLSVDVQARRSARCPTCRAS